MMAPLTGDALAFERHRHALDRHPDRLRYDARQLPLTQLLGREYTADEYYKLLDGLRYEEVVNYTDPTGDTAEKRYRDARFMFNPRYAYIERATTDPRYPVPWSYEGYARGSTDLKGAGQK